MYIYKTYNLVLRYEDFHKIFAKDLYPPWRITRVEPEISESDDQIIEDFKVSFPNSHLESIIVVKLKEEDEEILLVYPFNPPSDLHKLKPLEKLNNLKVFY